ncbi:capZ-interacting protein isoform 2-T2 [Discoglossus pictus]
MEGKSVENATEETPPPSVAKLAGIFGDKVNSPKKEKVSPQVPKLKVKSSPLIEKLQANLAFPTAPFIPGAPLKSPGIKVMASPFNSPPSTPSSPGIHSRSGEFEEVPVSFEQPPEGAHLPSYTKVRTKGSIKRRPPSRRFRKSQSDIGYEEGVGFIIPPNENGDKEEGADEVSDSKVKHKTKPMENTMSESAEKSSEAEQKDVTETAKENEEKEGEKKDNQHGGETTNDTNTQEGTKDLTVTTDTETANTKQSESPEKEVDNGQSKESEEDKPDAEK